MDDTATGRFAQLPRILLAGLLTGNEFGGWVAVHPTLGTLAAQPRLIAEQAVYRRYGRIMPVLMSTAIASGGPALAGIRDRRSPAFRLTLAGIACHAAMLAVTLTRNLPINARIVALPDEPASHAEFARLRDDWDRLHTIRNLLNLAGFALAVAGALAPRRRAGSPD